MKMNLEQLRVDSYSTQVSETELTSVKGGTTWVCLVVEVGVTVAIAYLEKESPKESPGSGTTTTIYGVKTDSTGVQIDSIRFVKKP